jgi:hypothetical protein
MVTKRRLQLGAAAVIVNGLLALSAMAPTPAVAASCTTQLFCGFCGNLSFCQAHAQPGCTATSGTCAGTGGCPPSHVWTICQYQ